MPCVVVLADLVAGCKRVTLCFLAGGDETTCHQFVTRMCVCLRLAEALHAGCCYGRDSLHKVSTLLPRHTSTGSGLV